MLLIDALYVNNSGGKVLLDYLINKIEESKIDVYYLIDDRCFQSYQKVLREDKVSYIKASVKNRKDFYIRNQEKFDTIFCFANLAPPIKCTGKVFTYFHNLLLSEIPKNTPIKKAILLYAKRYFAKRIASNSSTYIVQTNYGKQSFTKCYGNYPTLVLPFYNDFDISEGIKKNNTFLYVSDGNPHKNHQRLLEAWEKINDRNSELRLTVSNAYPLVVEQINKLKQKGFNVINFQNLDRKELNQIYAESEYMIYPSMLESFGLGLIEGALAGCKIIGSKLKYTTEVIETQYTFDEKNIDSIASTIENAKKIKIFQHRNLL